MYKIIRKHKKIPFLLSLADFPSAIIKQELQIAEILLAARKVTSKPVLNLIAKHELNIKISNLKSLSRFMGREQKGDFFFLVPFATIIPLEYGHYSKGGIKVGFYSNFNNSILDVRKTNSKTTNPKNQINP